MPRLTLVLIFALLFTSTFADITLVRDGQSQVVIIVPEGLSKQVQKPADQLTGRAMSVPLTGVELADYLQKVGGVRPLIATETQKGVEAASRIYIGHCQANADLVVQPEEFVIRTSGSDLHIRGGDAGPGSLICQGTHYGVHDLIERELGVRWLFPGEHGEVVPRRSTIIIPDLDRREQPRIEKRKVRNQAVTREDTFAPVLKQWGIAVEAWKAVHGPEETGAWFRRMRLGARIEIEGGHAYAGWWEKYGKDHPEWFALQSDGTRTQQSEREGLCKSNPALWDEITRVRIAEFKGDPSKRMASLAPNDGGANKWCMCAACRALDPAEAPKLPFAEYSALTDRAFTFFNEIAKRVRLEMPDRDLVAYAYSVYRTPPVKLGPLEPNLIIGYVELDSADIDA